MPNYPFNNECKVLKNTNYKNKGMFLEDIINNSNEFYNENNIALIYKKPTPIQIVKLSKDKKTIERAYFKSKSTTDYNGIYMGKYIDFEAKECDSKTSFPLKNIHEYQYNHLLKASKLGGISFIIFYFNQYDEYYLLFIEEIKKYLDENPNKNSIPYKYFVTLNHKTSLTLDFRIDYLKIVKDIIS